MLNVSILQQIGKMLIDRKMSHIVLQREAEGLLMYFSREQVSAILNSLTASFSKGGPSREAGASEDDEREYGQKAGMKKHHRWIIFFIVLAIRICGIGVYII